MSNRWKKKAKAPVLRVKGELFDWEIRPADLGERYRELPEAELRRRARELRAFLESRGGLVSAGSLPLWTEVAFLERCAACELEMNGGAWAQGAGEIATC